MRPALIPIVGACLLGCSAKTGKDGDSKRYLHFTSAFPEGTHWVFDETFKSSSGNLLCKDFSMGQGGLVPSTKYRQYILQAPTDTLKVPLFWPEGNRCGWELVGLSVDLKGQSISMPQMHLKKKAWEYFRPSRIIPDTLAYSCKRKPETSGIECEVDSENEDINFFLNDSIDVNHFRVEIKGL